MTLRRAGSTWQRTGYRVVRGCGRAVDLFILALILLCLASLLPRLVPELAGEPVMQHLREYCALLHAPFAGLLPPMCQSYARLTVITVIMLFILRNLLNWRLDRLITHEQARNAAMMQQAAAGAGANAAEEKRRQAACRRVAVASYTEAKAVLEAQKQDLAFLSLDLAGSTRMKDGEDGYVVEHAFAGYRRLVEQIVARHAVYKSAWTPDGQMFAFRQPDAAVLAAQEVLAALPCFNREVSKMKQPFRLRAGINAGVISTDDATPMEQIIDEAVDVAGHLQKYCAPGELWITARVFERLCARDGFAANGQQVDGHAVYAWRPAGATGPSAAGAA